MPIKIYQKPNSLIFPNIKVTQNISDSIKEVKEKLNIQTLRYSTTVRVSKVIVLYSKEYQNILSNLCSKYPYLKNTGGQHYKNNLEAYEMGLILSVNKDHPPIFFTSQEGFIKEIGSPVSNPWQCLHEIHEFLFLQGSENKNYIKLYDLFHKDFWIPKVMFSKYNSQSNASKHWIGNGLEIMSANIDRIVQVDNPFFKRLNKDLRLLNKLVVGCTDSKHYIPEDKFEKYLSDPFAPVSKAELRKFHENTFRRVSVVISNRGEVLCVDTQSTQIVKSIGKLNPKDASSYKRILGLIKFKQTHHNEKLIKGSLV